MGAIQKLHDLGQSIWYDNIQRLLLENGELAAMIERGEIRGVTSNPTIFKKAIANSDDYTEEIAALSAQGLGREEIYEALAIADIQAATDLFRPLYEESNSEDGYVSLEVSPYLARDTAATLAEAKRLWKAVDRPNLMIKIPGTKEGLPAVTQAIAAGLNVNVTLIFSVKRYKKIMDAYLAGLEQRVEAGLPLDGTASVASFFISRIETNVDDRLEALIGEGERAAETLFGRAAVASGKLAYEEYRQAFGDENERFAALKAKGARPQRLLFASTSTKNPAYSDVKYVEELIGPGTVNTIPPKTIDAFRDHGIPQVRVTEGVASAHQAFEELAALGIDMDDVTQELEDAGVKSFADAFTALLESVTGDQGLVTRNQ